MNADLIAGMEVERDKALINAGLCRNGDFQTAAESWEEYAKLYEEVITALREADARVAEARRQALEEAAQVAENCSKGYDIDWWMTATKKQVSATICLDVAAAIRDLAAKEQTDER